MKDFKFIIANLLLLYSVTITACASSKITWDGDAVIADGKKYEIDISLQDVAKEFVINKKLFITGYQIDSSGINYPSVVWFNDKYSRSFYKRFEYDIQDIFEYNNQIYLLDSTGAVFKFLGQAWKLSGIKLQQNSYVIYSEDDIIACQPASLFKNSKERGKCYSVNKEWSVEINWTDIMPKMCGDELKAIGRLQKNKAAWKVDIETGKSLIRKDISSDISDPCKVIFN